jgi:hypothetical protein
MLRKILVGSLLAAVLWPPFGRPEDGPAPRLKLIFVERFRFEAWDNAANLDDSAADANAYTRNRTTLGLSWKAARNLEVLGKVTNEFRVYLAPKDRAFDWNEVFVDNLYLKWTIPGRLPLAITVGRQDMNFGEGFVIADGTPLDGSRSYYFNAVRIDADVSKNHRLTVFGQIQETTDRYLPVIHEVPRPLAEQAESALALYYSGTLGVTRLDAYAVRRTAEANEAWAVVPLAKPLALTAEAAVQTGAFGDAGRSAYGGIAHFDCDLAATLPLLKSATVGAILLSGDDPETAGMEGWDPIFSRWPKWSESYIYTLARESRPSYWSNLSSLYGSLAFDLGSRSDALLMVQKLGAEHPQPGIFPGGAGRSRGMLVKGRLNYKITQNLSGRVIWEHFSPGSFYFEGAAGYNWIQFELIFRY